MHSPFEGRRRARRLLIAALSLTAMAIPVASASAATSVAGSVNFMRSAEGSFDAFTSAPTTAQQAWMKGHYWRMRAYAPYFDSRLSWSSKAWAYQSAYAIYPGSSLDIQHPEWILRDAAGNKLYIPFGWPIASGGSIRPGRGWRRAMPASTSMTSTCIARSPTASGSWSLRSTRARVRR
jgi:hypothetical protein